MALWKEQPNARKDTPAPADAAPTPHPPVEAAAQEYAPPAVEPMRTAKRPDVTESVIGADLAIEGAITGNGNVRLAGRFTGDVTVDGTVTIEAGAKLSGGVRAVTVAIAGELEGNVIEATRVDVHASGAVTGDLKADTLTLAAGSRVRGHVDCGWADSPPRGRKGGERSSSVRSGDGVPTSSTPPAARNGNTATVAESPSPEPESAATS